MKKEPTYQDAKKRCRLTDEEMEMARRLGIKPRTLIHNIPAVSGKKEPWKDRPGVWVRKIYARKYPGEALHREGNEQPDTDN